jgi:hypothetical protein
MESSMLEAHQIEELITLACAMDGAAIKRELVGFRGEFPLDFTPEFLDGLPVERLRHIYVALCLQVQKVPSVPDLLPSAA